MTVSTARTARPNGSPVSASRPDGTSTASTGRAHPLIASMSCPGSPRTFPASPVPRSASTTSPAPPHARTTGSGRSASVTSMPASSRRRRLTPASPATSCLAAARNTWTRRPSSLRWRAATNPSPPLLPRPHTMTMGRSRPASVRRAAASATARPAFSISVRPGTPRSSIALRSNSRICCVVTIFTSRRSPAVGSRHGRRSPADAPAARTRRRGRGCGTATRAAGRPQRLPPAQPPSRAARSPVGRRDR